MSWVRDRFLKLGRSVWVTLCKCGHANPADKLVISKDGLKCNKCDGKLDVRNGAWQHPDATPNLVPISKEELAAPIIIEGVKYQRISSPLL